MANATRAAGPRTRRGGRRGDGDHVRSGQTIRLSLLPFVDIVFGTIGIFTVVFAVQNVLEAKEGIEPGVDSIVTCTDGKRLTAHWPDGAAAPAAPPEESLELLTALGDSERPFRSLILALGGECAKVRSVFIRAFERYRDVTRHASIAAGRDAPPYVLLELYPIGDESDATALLARWRSEDGDE